MSELNTTIPDRPAGWSMSDEGYELVARMDYYGQPYQVWQKIDKRPNYGELWNRFRAMERANQSYIASIGGNGLRLDPGKQDTLITIENNKI